MNTQLNPRPAKRGNRQLIDRFKSVYRDNHVEVCECQNCGEQLRFTPKASIATINYERAAHQCRKVA